MTQEFYTLSGLKSGVLKIRTLAICSNRRGEVYQKFRTGMIYDNFILGKIQCCCISAGLPCEQMVLFRAPQKQDLTEKDKFLKSNYLIRLVRQISTGDSPRRSPNQLLLYAFNRFFRLRRLSILLLVYFLNHSMTISKFFDQTGS